MPLRFTSFAAAALIAVAACGGGSGGGGSSRTALADASSPPLSLSSDANAKTVSFGLVASYNGANSGFNFDGHSAGNLEIDVPQGWSVTITCGNKGPLNHSCAVVADETAGQPLFTGATTPNPGAGLPAGQQASFTFKPDRIGTFRIVCLVPGHEPEGMWIAFKVVGSGSPAAYTVTG
jgi:predicted small lipoprotein YifL